MENDGTYSLQEIRNGTGWARDTRFRPVDPKASLKLQVDVTWDRVNGDFDSTIICDPELAKLMDVPIIRIIDRETGQVLYGNNAADPADPEQTLRDIVIAVLQNDSAADQLQQIYELLEDAGYKIP